MAAGKAVLARSLQVERPERRFCFLSAAVAGVSVRERPRGGPGRGAVRPTEFSAKRKLGRSSPAKRERLRVTVKDIAVRICRRKGGGVGVRL